MRHALTFTLLSLIAGTASAHMVYIVPNPQFNEALIILSEDLDADPRVPLDKLKPITLKLREGNRNETKLDVQADKNALRVPLPKNVKGIVFGMLEYGVMTKGDKPYLLAYHPKTILGGIVGIKAKHGKLVAELTPIRTDKGWKLQLLNRGKPVADAEIDLIFADGKGGIVKTDAKGMTPVQTALGRIGAWAKVIEAKSGNLDGQDYTEVRHYATLVTDIMPTIPDLDQGVSSLGAIRAGDFLYTYGGHAGKTHSYDIETAQGTLRRLDLTKPQAKWETLIDGPKVQGMNLAAIGDTVYRVGGMQPLNPVGEKGNLVSISDVAAYEPSTKKWTALPALPVGRSSHDVIAVGDKLVVVGGWEMRGKNEESNWLDTTLILDTSAKAPKWESVPQPFKRRALTTAVLDGKVYVIGGMDEDGDVTNRVDVFDVATRTWSEGPAMPSNDRHGFSPAACPLNGTILLSTVDGDIHALNAKRDGWIKVGQSESKRMVHRMVPYDQTTVLLVGGAEPGVGNGAQVEVVPIQQ